MKQFRLFKSILKHAFTRNTHSGHTVNPVSRLENLEPRMLMSGTPLITEFMAINGNTLTDNFGDNPDWLEITNPTTDPISLDGWHLSDDPLVPDMWTFPDITLNPGDYLLIYASDRDIHQTGSPLHTNFKLSGEGDNLILSDPSLTPIHQYLNYPQQIEDVSFGLPTATSTDELIAFGDSAKYLIPLDDTVDSTFTDINFDDSSWTDGTTGIGYFAGATVVSVEIANSQTEFSGVQNQDNWRHGVYAFTNTLNSPTYDYTKFSALPTSVYNGTEWFVGSTGATVGATELTPGVTSPVNGRHYAVRRWTSEVTGNINIAGQFNNPDGSGDGVVGRIQVNGNEIYTQSLNGASDDYNVDTFVNAGDFVDFVVELGGNDDKVGDASTFTAIISELQTESIDPEEIANSIDDWSDGGVQGENNWSYGYWNMTTDPDNDGSNNPAFYDTTDFIAGTNDGNEYSWSGSSWDWANAGGAPWTQMGQTDYHPNGANNTNIHFAIRRYQAEVSGDLSVNWKMWEVNTSGDGVTGHVYHNGVQVDVATIAGGDTVGADRTIVIPNVQIGDLIDFAMSPDGTNNGGVSRLNTYNDGSDGSAMSATISVVPDLAGALDTDVETEMKDNASSLYLRQEFDITDPGAFDTLTLQMRYNDGFVAYINGVEVASSNAPAEGLLNFDSLATGSQSLAETLSVSNFNVTEGIDALVTGTNVLTIHAMNDQVDDNDFFVETRLIGQTINIDEQGIVYFADPTPGAVNNAGTDNLGPIIDDLTNAPFVNDVDDIVITTRVVPTLAAVANVELRYRVMYGSETTLTMLDDGTNGDAVAGDGVYTAVIPANAAAAGEMVRWYVLASDTEGASTRAPVFDSATDSEQYFGTIIQDPTVDQGLPVFHWFTPSLSAAQTDGGNRGSLYYNGEFYDNVLADLHGQSTRGLPKKSFDFDFTKDHRFELDPNIPKMKDFNLLSNYADRADMRNTLSYEIFAAVGGDHHLAFPVNLQLNGNFYAVYDFVEDGDDRWIDRLGYDKDGTLYKMYNTFNSGTNGAEKKSNKGTPNTDLINVVSNVNSLTGTALNNYIYDNINLAAMANYLAAMVITSTQDCCHKNYYAFFDTDDTGEMWFMPWDVDLSLGRNWTGSYHDYTIYHQNALFLGQNNALISRLYNIPEFEEMYLRRFRSQMDLIFQEPGTPEEELFLENRIEELRAEIGDLGQLDIDIHGQANDTQGDWPAETFQQAVDSLINDHVKLRREFLYSLTADGEVTGPTATLLSGNVGGAPLKYIVPTDNTLGTTWTDPGFDDALWSNGTMGIGYENTPADYAGLISTVVQPNQVNAAATTAMVRIPFNVTDLSEIDNLVLRMKYDDGFVAYLNGVQVASAGVGGTVNWDTTAANHADGQAVNYQNFTISSHIDELVIGENVLAIQVVNQATTSSDMLLIAEVVQNFNVGTGGTQLPAGQVNTAGMIEFSTIDFNPISGNQDEEYIQLVNTTGDAVDLSGWEISGGVEHSFVHGTVIPANSTMYIAKDAKAFRARATGPSGGQGLFVQGNYKGNLSNFGELLNLTDENGLLIHSITSPADPTDHQEALRVTEINYHPADPTQAEFDAGFTNDGVFEFIELRNVSDSITLDLTGVQFVSGIDFDFTGSNVTTLGPDEYVLVVKNQSAFEMRYGTKYADRIAGEFQNETSLNNDKEVISIDGPQGEGILEFDYEDDWYVQTDGNGLTLDIVDEDNLDREAWDSKLGWRNSGITHGTPGRPDPTDGALPGDANYDNIINIADLAKLASNFNVQHDDVIWEMGDFNGDKIINIADLSLLASRFGNSGGYGFEGGAAAALNITSEESNNEAILFGTNQGNAEASAGSWTHINSILDESDEDELDYLV